TQLDRTEFGVTGHTVRVQVVVLVQRCPVDQDPVLVVAALHDVPGQAHDPFDVFLTGGDGAELLLCPLEPTSQGVLRFGDGDGVRVVPRPSPVEDDDLTAFDVTDLVDDLVDEHSIPDQKGVLHRRGRDVERLHHPG